MSNSVVVWIIGGDEIQVDKIITSGNSFSYRFLIASDDDFTVSFNDEINQQGEYFRPDTITATKITQVNNASGVVEFSAHENAAVTATKDMKIEIPKYIRGAVLHSDGVIEAGVFAFQVNYVRSDMQRGKQVIHRG